MDMRPKSFGKDRRGGIEGLPLQLMIVILVATMGTAIIMGWMGDIDSPHYIKTLNIDENIVEIQDGVVGDIHICVVDESGEPLEGVSVRISNKQVSGPGVNFVNTDSDGTAVLSGWTLSDSYPKSTIKLTVSAYYSGYTGCEEYVEGLIV